MHLRKGFALLAAALVGFGASSVGAQATIQSLTVTTGTSTGIVGIDSTFTVTAKVQDFVQNSGDGVLLYLFAGTDTTNAMKGWTGNLPVIGSTSAGTGVSTSQAAIAIIGGGSSAAAGSGVIAASYDSIKVSSDKSTYTWYGKVSADFDTATVVRAAAFPYDGGGAGIGSRYVSSTSISIDGDRPPSGELIVTTGGVARGTANPINWTGGSSSSYNVYGIGDTIAFKVKLGSTAANAVFNTGNQLSIKANIFGNDFAVPSSFANTQDTVSFRRTIVAGDFGDLTGVTSDTHTDTIEVFVVDKAGNRSAWSGTNATSSLGVTAPVSFLVDAKLPVLDGQVAAGDTILPVSNDTITDGGIDVVGTQDDLNPITYKLAEALDSLFITFDGTTDLTLKLHNQGNSNSDSWLAAGPSSAVTVNFASAHSSKVGTSDSFTAVNASATQSAAYTAVSGKVTTGVQTVKFQATDLAGNKGPELVRTGVYVDVDNLKFNRLFPTAASALDTIDQETAKVIFQLSEDADSVLITYTPITGNGTSTRTRALVGSELTSDLEQVFALDSLVTGTSYQLQLVGADLAGNYVQTSPDTFVYDTTYVVPVIAKFAITSSAYRPAAGDTISLTLQAKTVDDKNAVTYKKAAILKLTNASGAYISGTGVAAAGDGRFTLTADDWITGARTVKVSSATITADTANAATHISASVVDSNDVNNIYAGTIDTTIAILPAALSQIAMSAPDTVGQGDTFWVGLTLADKYGNTRDTDAGFVELATNAIGVQIPANAIELKKGVGGFWANSSGYSGSLTITARGISGSTGVAGETGSLTVVVDGNGATVLDDPDEIIGEDYMGALGTGDQGGFVLLTFPASDDHSTLSGYRIYREVMVNYAADGNGGLVALETPTSEMVPWAHIDAVPGQTVVRAVVATLDGDATMWGVAAERGGLSSKEAFDTAEALSSPYELMAETMVKSKEAAQLDPSAPVFATLSPEALAFDANGVVPRFKTTDDILLSAIRETETAVRAIDNIAPAPIVSLQAMDTQEDAGSSITVTWSKSADDRMLTTTVANAVGESQTYTTAGVEGYNVYRRIGDAAWQMVGQTGAGETRFEDVTVFNGVRYAYKVEARDTDNVTDSGLEKSAMAIRNNVVDASGQPVIGLFGADNKVDIDDFFIFADHYGMTAGIDGYDVAFDLDRNNTVDLADFFVFADNFGREIVGAGKVVPTMAGLNSDARFYVSAGADMPGVGEEISIAVNLEDFVEVRGYGLTVDFDSELLEFVEPRVVDNALGETELATPRAIPTADGSVTIAALGQTVSEGDLGLNLIFRAKQEIESSYIEVASGAVTDGSYGLNRITNPVSIRVETRPEVYALEDNYPNPFNPETTIKYQLPEAGQVTLEVYNMLGQVVKTLVDNQFQNAGRYTLQWDATNNSGQALSSGVYFYRITAGGEFQSHKKMLLLK